MIEPEPYKVGRLFSWNRANVHRIATQAEKERRLRAADKGIREARAKR